MRMCPVCTWNHGMWKISRMGSYAGARAVEQLGVLSSDAFNGHPKSSTALRFLGSFSSAGSLFMSTTFVVMSVCASGM